MKVLFFTNIPSPYRVDFFNELGKKVELTVAFERKTATDRDDSWYSQKFIFFNAKFLKVRQIKEESSFGFDAVRLLKKQNYDLVVFDGYSSPTMIFAIAYCRRKKKNYLISFDGILKQKDGGLLRLLKKYLFGRAKGVLFSNMSAEKYLSTYNKRLYLYPFTSLFERDIVASLPSLEGKRSLRKKLGLVEEKIVVSVGRFITVKGFDIAINSLHHLSDNVGLYLIGGRPTEEYLQLIEQQKADRIHFVDFMDKNALNEYYQAADLLIMPTRGDVWGLVVNEAMANGLPIVSSDRCVAAVELVKEGENGYIVPVDDEKALAEAINKVLENEETKLQMSQASLEIIRAYTFENMAKRHIEVFEQCLKE